MMYDRLFLLPPAGWRRRWRRREEPHPAGARQTLPEPVPHQRSPLCRPASTSSRITVATSSSSRQLRVVPQQALQWTEGVLLVGGKDVPDHHQT